MSVSRSLGRAAALGLAGGLAIAAVTLLVFSVLRMQVDCTGLGPEECTFERQISNDIARTQAFSALGLACVSAGAFLFARKPAQKAT